MAKRLHYCFNCGEDLGVFDAWPGDVLTCGRRECEREARYVYQERDADAQESAREDNYDRYR